MSQTAMPVRASVSIENIEAEVDDGVILNYNRSWGGNLRNMESLKSEVMHSS